MLWQACPYNINNSTMEGSNTDNYDNPYIAYNMLYEVISEMFADNNINDSWLKKKELLEKNAQTLKRLETILPEGWVPLRIACSGLLTQQTSVDKVNFPRTVDDWLKVWDEIAPIKERQQNMSSEFTAWLKNNGNHHFAVRFGEYYEFYWKSRSWSLEKSNEDLKTLRTKQTAEDVKKWWKEFKGIGNQYSKNIPMDEMDDRFKNYVKIDYRLSKLIDLTGATKLKPVDMQNIYLNIARELSLTGWDIDRFCFNFFGIITNKLQLRNKNK